jgi:alkanesulfonate monooxygenase SsuD/methylene tetrahydromethanopterin reductase-like flavin-dependent oxidoreductase (luciferase family)
MVAAGCFAAETDDEARRLFTSAQQQFMNLRRGRPGPLPPPVESMDRLWTPVERAGVERALSRAIVGSPAVVQRGIVDLVAATQADELMLTAQIFDHDARLRSFEIAADAAA